MGELQLGSSLETQIWYEPYHARAFRFFEKTDFSRSLSWNVSARFSGLWFLVLIPRACNFKAVDRTFISRDITQEGNDHICHSIVDRPVVARVAERPDLNGHKEGFIVSNLISFH